ncbi:voltage-gated potassium channel [Chitinophaga jiangningensis]|uniref:Voltage-gated potassium channel n=1 Tax=Chitinophaga jiangningensis TaxID=1419482 RepID=A0A1M7AW41_9BACT|nr:ion transporter [Chitinophaga jiangningensis]SHL46867.1 voltage-gated potassium channel [Chitinophaga jiangningensis]
MTNETHKHRSALRKQLYRTIFLSDTPAGRVFDICLLIIILASVAIVMMESVQPLQIRYSSLFNWLEWVFTILFTLEYLLRVWCTPKPKRYITSFYGIIDLLCVIPSYVEFLMGGGHFLITIRILRLMRIFRIFKLVPFLHEGRQLMLALQRSRRKIAVFFFFIMLLTVVLGSIMYVIESSHNSGFTSIPVSIYWAVVTLTTVGYGDIAPVTPIGQAFSAVIMIMGYAIIAVPTGIVTAEMTRMRRAAYDLKARECPGCHMKIDDHDALFCKYCGTHL